MPYTGIERVDNTVGQANSSDFLIRPTIVMHYATEVCETFGDLDILTTCMNRLNCVIQETSLFSATLALSWPTVLWTSSE